MMRKSATIVAGLLGDPGQINRNRAVFLYALGALIGLGLSGYGLFTAQGTSTRKVPPESVALVNNRPILRSDFITQLENGTGASFADSSHEEQLKVLGEMVHEELLVQRGLELDLAESDQDTRNALVSALTQLALAQVTLAGVPDESTLRQYFAAHPEQYSTPGLLTVEDLYLPHNTATATDPTSLASIAQALQQQPANQVISRYGIQQAQGAHEDWYWVARLHLGEEMFQHVKSRPAGAVFGPQLEPDGVHFAIVRQNVAPVPLSFEKARAQVTSDYAKGAQTRLMQDTLNFLRDRSRILITDQYADYKP